MKQTKKPIQKHTEDPRRDCQHCIELIKAPLPRVREPKEVNDTGCGCICHCPQGGIICPNEHIVPCEHCAPTKTSWEERFEWTFEDYRNKNSLGYMTTTIGDVRKLKDYVASELTTQREEIKREILKLDKGEIVDFKGNKYEFYRVEDVLELLSKE